MFKLDALAPKPLGNWTPNTRWHCKNTVLRILVELLQSCFCATQS